LVIKNEFNLDSQKSALEVQHTETSLLELNKLKLALRDFENDNLSTVSKQLDIWKQDLHFSIEVAEHTIFED